MYSFLAYIGCACGEEPSSLNARQAANLTEHALQQRRIVVYLLEILDSIFADRRGFCWAAVLLFIPLGLNG
jgi:hypothetical protein